MNNKILGNLGERIAKIYLQINGYQILKCNFRCRFGEIDLIAQKEGTLHFIEVKTRTHSFIEARLSIGSVKERHIWKTAEYYIYINRIEDVEIQFDAIEVYIKKTKIYINHIKQII